MKLCTLLLALTLIVALVSIPVNAANATISLSASGNVVVGKKVNVTIKITGGEAIGSWNFSLNYDPAYLEYVSGADTAGGGAARFADSVDSGVKTITKTVTFLTKKIGTTSVSVKSPQVVGFDSLTNLNTGSATRNITISAAPTLSDNNKLASLSVSPGELSPAFQTATTSYAVTVPFETTKLDVAAGAEHTAASVAISATDLAVGENKIDVTVTAQNGKTKVYTITVTRQESELAGVTTQLNGTNYTVAHDPTTFTVPEGFTPTTSLLGDKKILSYASPAETIRIVYLMGENSGDWYVFEETAQSFSPLVTLSGNASSFVILNVPEDKTVPAGYLPESLLVAEKSVSAYQSADSKLKKIYLVYAMAKDGSTGFYYYDSTLSSFLSYFEESVPTVEEEEVPTPSTSEEDKARINRLEITVLALGLVSVLLGIGWILTVVWKRKKQGEQEVDQQEDKDILL